MHVSAPDRRDRLWLVNAFAVVLLTLLGAAGEALGYDRHLKSNTTKRRTHSLFRSADKTALQRLEVRLCRCDRVRPLRLNVPPLWSELYARLV